MNKRVEFQIVATVNLSEKDIALAVCRPELVHLPINKVVEAYGREVLNLPVESQLIRYDSGNSSVTLVFAETGNSPPTLTMKPSGFDYTF